MRHTKHPALHLLGAAGLALALTAILPASAQEFQSTQSAQSADSLTVVRDAETGKLRGATAAEQAALKAANARFTLRAAPALPVPKYHASGARGLRLTEDFMNNTVAVRKPDGSVQVVHGSLDAAAPAAPAPVTE